MKRIIFPAVLCVVSSGLFAQLSKGTLFVGSTIGTANYNSVTNDHDYIDSGFRKTINHNFGIGLSPQMGVFVNSHLVVGGSLGFDYAHNKQNIESTEGNVDYRDTRKNTFTINAGPFARYYVFKASPGSTLFFTQLDARVGTGSGNSSGNGDNTNNTFTSSAKISKIFNWNAGGSIGITHFIQKSVGLDAFAGYSYNHNKSYNTATTDYTSKADGENSSRTIGYDLTTHTNNIVLGVGFHWFFVSHKS
jgi:hypothetical protein